METDGQDRGSDGRIRGRHQGVNANSLLAKTSASHLFLILTWPPSLFLSILVTNSPTFCTLLLHKLLIPPASPFSKVMMDGWKFCYFDSRIDWLHVGDQRSMSLLLFPLFFFFLQPLLKNPYNNNDTIIRLALGYDNVMRKGKSTEEQKSRMFSNSRFGWLRIDETILQQCFKCVLRICFSNCSFFAPTYVQYLKTSTNMARINISFIDEACERIQE